MDSEKDSGDTLGLTQEDLESLFESTFNQLQNKSSENSQNNTPNPPLFESSFSSPPIENDLSPVSVSESEKIKPDKATSRAKTSLRLKYEAEVQAFIKEKGGLESIRRQLGLSKRKMAQLLLVDPSAWTRWTSKEGEAPPHIYRSLEWYLLLQEKHPEYKSSLWLNAVSRPQMHPKEIESIKNQVIESAKDQLFEFDEKLRDEQFRERRKLQSELSQASLRVSQLGRGFKTLVVLQFATILVLLLTLIFF